MSGRHVVRLTRPDDGVAIITGELQLPLQHDTPMRALTTVVGQTAEQFGEVGVGGVGLEPDGVVAELSEMAFVSIELHRIRSVAPVEFGHDRLSFLGGVIGIGASRRLGRIYDRSSVVSLPCRSARDATGAGTTGWSPTGMQHDMSGWHAAGGGEARSASSTSLS